MSQKTQSITAYIILFLFSFVFFLPLVSGFIAMGNDFDQVYFAYKKYIFEFYQEGEIPFWSPSEGAGYSLVFNPFAQFFFPPSWILYFILNFFDVFSLQIYFIYIIFFVSLFSIFQFQWLKSLNLFNKKNCYLVSLLTPCCLIISNFLRFPNAILTITWLPLLLLGINYCCRKKKYFKSFIIIFTSSLCMFTAGYPYIVIYFFFFCLCYTFFSYFYFPKEFNFFIYILRVAIPVLLSMLIISPWLFGIIKTLEITQDRNIHDLNYATQHIFYIKDFISSLVYPIASNTEGRFFFGSFVSFLIFYFIFSKQKKIFENKKINYFFIFLIIIVFFTLVMASANNFIFEIIWNKITFIQNLRTWPRINILMFPIMSILLCFSLQLISDKNYKFNEIKLVNILLFSILFLQLFFIIFDLRDHYWFEWHQKRFEFAKNYFDNSLSYLFTFNESFINLFSTILIILFFNFLFFNKKINKIKKIKYLYIFLVLIVSFEQFLNSNLQWSLKDWKTEKTEIHFDAKNSFERNFYKSRGTKRVYGNHYFRDDEFSINMYWNWGNVFHNKIFWNYFSYVNGNFKEGIYHKEKDKIFLFYGLDNNAKKIFFSKNLNSKNIIDFIDHSINFEKLNNCNYKFLKISNNQIILEFFCSEDGYISYIDNTDVFWKAYLNGKKIVINKLFDSYKSVKFYKGKNTLLFRYSPFDYKF